MTDCICAQHGDLECPTHPDCASCGCQAHAHWQGDQNGYVEPYACIAGRVGCGCKRYRPHGFSLVTAGCPTGVTATITPVTSELTGGPGFDLVIKTDPGARTPFADQLYDKPETFDPAERAREKQASRDADAQALADGTKTVEQLRRENSAFAFPRDRVKLTPPKRER